MPGRPDQGHDERGFARGKRIVGAIPWHADDRSGEPDGAVRLGPGRAIGRLPALPGARGQAEHGTRSLGAQPGRLRFDDQVTDHLLLRRREPLANIEARDSARSFFSSKV